MPLGPDPMFAWPLVIAQALAPLIVVVAVLVSAMVAWCVRWRRQCPREHA